MGIRLFSYQPNFTVENAKDQLRQLIVLAVQGDDEGLIPSLTKPLFGVYWALKDLEEADLPEERQEAWTRDDREVVRIFCETYWKAVCRHRGEQFNQEIVDQHDGDQPIDYDLQDALYDGKVRVPKWFVREWALATFEHALAVTQQFKRLQVVEQKKA